MAEMQGRKMQTKGRHVTKKLESISELLFYGRCKGDVGIKIRHILRCCVSHHISKNLFPQFIQVSAIRLSCGGPLNPCIRVCGCIVAISLLLGHRLEKSPRRAYKSTSGAWSSVATSRVAAAYSRSGSI